jgi:hypothetical protein
VVPLIAHILFNPCPHGLRIEQVAFALKSAGDICSTTHSKTVLDAIICVQRSEASFLSSRQGILRTADLASVNWSHSGTGSTIQHTVRTGLHRATFHLSIPDVVHCALLGVYDSGRVFRYVSGSLNARNIRLSEFEHSFKLEVKRVEEKILN